MDALGAGTCIGLQQATGRATEQASWAKPRLAARVSPSGPFTLDMLFSHIATTLRLHCRVTWEPNTLTLWDNRCTQHHAVWDYYPYSRRGERVSVVGEKPPSR